MKSDIAEMVFGFLLAVLAGFGIYATAPAVFVSSPDPIAGMLLALVAIVAVAGVTLVIDGWRGPNPVTTNRS